MERKLLKPIYECRCNGRLETKIFTRLTHNGSVKRESDLPFFFSATEAEEPRVRKEKKMRWRRREG